MALPLSLAPSSRARCVECSQQIARGSVRFGPFTGRYYHNRCVQPLIVERRRARLASASAVDGLRIHQGHFAIRCVVGSYWEVRAQSYAVRFQVSATLADLRQVDFGGDAQQARLVSLCERVSAEGVGVFQFVNFPDPLLDSGSDGTSQSEYSDDDDENNTPNADGLDDPNLTPTRTQLLRAIRAALSQFPA